MYALLPKTLYALEGEYCCPPDADVCLMMLAPCDIRHGWIGGILLANLVISVLAFALEMKKKN